MSNKKFTELTSIDNTTIVSTDVFAVTDVSANESKKVTLAALQSSLLSPEVYVNNAGSIITALNSYDPNATGENTLNATKLFDGTDYQNGSYFLDYDNFINSPTSVTDLSGFTNTTGFTQFDSVSDQLKYKTIVITTDFISEGSTNKYYDGDDVSTRITNSFADLFASYSDSFDNGDVRDSLDGISGTFINLESGQSDEIIISDRSIIGNYAVGDTLRIFGASTTSADLTGTVTTSTSVSGFRTSGHGSDAQVTIKYRICLFDTVTGKISAPLGSEIEPGEISVDGIASAPEVLSSFNTDNFIKLTFSGESSDDSSRGLLVYRSVGGALFKLTSVLGPRDFGNNGSREFIDYYTFDYVSWSGKDPLDNTFSSIYPITHFPVVAQLAAQRGWVDASIESIASTESNFTLTLVNNVYPSASATATITHNDTAAINSAISTKLLINKKNLLLNPKTYYVSSLTIPDNFSLSGAPNVTKIKRIPFSGGTIGTEHSNVIKSSSISQAKNISIIGLDIDGNLTNQMSFADSSSPAKNYLVNFGIQSSGIIIDRCRITNSIGGGVYAPNPEGIKITTSEVQNGGISDQFSYSPLIIDSGTNTTVVSSIFSNFTDSVNASVTTRGVITNNTITNCGSGLFVYGSTFLLSSPNVLTGPANEFISAPDTLNSEFDSINITPVASNGDFTSPVFKYQEGGDAFLLNQTATGGASAEIIHRAFYVKKNSVGVESVYGTIRNAADYSADNSSGPVHGVRYTIVSLGDTVFTEGANAVVNLVGAEFIYNDGSSGNRTSSLFSGTGTISSSAVDSIKLTNIPQAQDTLPGDFKFSIDAPTVVKLKTAPTTKLFDGGDRTTPVVDTTNNRITILNHGFLTGTEVVYTATSAVLAPLVSTTKYFVHAIDTNTIALYPTSAQALSTGATTGILAFSNEQVDAATDGSSNHRLLQGGEFSFDYLKAQDPDHVAVAWSSSFRNEVADVPISSGAWQLQDSSLYPEEALKAFNGNSNVNSKTNTITITGHELAVSDQVKYRIQTSSTVLTGLTNATTTYFVSACGKTTNTVRLASTSNNALGYTILNDKLSIADTGGKLAVVSNQNIVLNDRLVITGTISGGSITSYNTAGTVYRVVYVKGDNLATLIAKEDGTDFTIGNSRTGNSQIDKASHPFLTGGPVVYRKADAAHQVLVGTFGGSAANIADGSLLFTRIISSDAFQLHQNYEESISGSNPLVITDGGNAAQILENIAVVTSAGALAGSTIKRHPIVDITARPSSDAGHSLNRNSNIGKYTVTHSTQDAKYLSAGKRVILRNHVDFNTDTGIQYGVVRSVILESKQVIIDYHNAGRIFDVTQPGGGNTIAQTNGTGGNGHDDGTATGTINIIDTFVMAQGTIT